MNPNANFKQFLLSAGHGLVFAVTFVGSVLSAGAIGIYFASVAKVCGWSPLPAAILGTAVLAGLLVFVALKWLDPYLVWVMPRLRPIFPPNETR
jgi:hypothetical protein